jgi:hypothetical protein
MNSLSKRISALIVAVMMTTAIGCASTSTKEGTGEYVDDSVITTKVKTAIFNEPTLKSREIKLAFRSRPRRGRGAQRQRREVGQGRHAPQIVAGNRLQAG